MIKQPRGEELIVAGDLNVGLEGKDGRVWDEEIAEAIATSGIEDLAGHFLPRQWAWCKYWKTWVMVSQGRVVRSLIDYIMGYYFRIFQNVTVRDPRHNSDYLMVMWCLRRAFFRDRSHCLGRRMCLPLQLPGRQKRMQADKIFAELRRAVLKPDKRAVRHKPWILAETWRLVDERLSVRR